MTDEQRERERHAVLMTAWEQSRRDGVPMRPVSRGFGGVVYWRSDGTVNGRYLWRITTAKDEVQ